MRSGTTATAAAAIAALAILATGADEPTRLRALIVDGQSNHDWRSTTRELLAALEKSGRFRIDVATAPARPDARAGEAAMDRYRAAMERFVPDLDRFDVLIDNYNGDPWPEAFRRSLIEHVRAGRLGLVVVHAANHPFADWPEFNRMMGLGWRDDPKAGPALKVADDGTITRTPAGQGPGATWEPKRPVTITIRDGDHPITRGMPARWRHAADEVYHTLRGPAEGLHLLASYRSDGAGGPHEPAAWTIEYGRGRVFVTPLGHDAEGQRCPGFVALLDRGAEWAATGRVTLAWPADGPGVPPPPRAEVIPTRLDRFGRTRVDNYYWLKDRTDPRVIAYLDAENAYTEALMAPTRTLQQTLYDEIVGRIKQADTTAPVFDNGCFYYARFEAGKQYPILVRRKGTMEAPEEVLIDENALAEGRGYFSMGGGKVSPDNRLIVYGIDTGGRLFYTIRVKDLATGKILDDSIPDVTPNVVWANDSRTLFYTKQDPNTLRHFQIRRHRLGTPAADDPVVYEEKDETFSCHVARTKSDRYLMIASHQTLSSECRFLDADKPEGTFTVLQPRRPRLEYSADHLGDDFYIRTNLDAKNFRLMKAPVASPGLEGWQEVIPHRADVFLEDFALFRGFLALEERRDGLIRLRIRPWSGRGEHEIDFGEPAYRAGIGPNEEVDTDTLRFIYTSMTTPMSSFDYDMKTRAKTLVKREEVLGGFDPANYVTERRHATAADGVKVPISIVYRKGFPRDGSRPLLLYGYGSYGATMDASFDPARLSLLDRGFAYAIAHIRGGQELGRAWYEDGKLLRKKNTFTDFIACAEHLVREGYTRPDRLFAMGGSAGGLLIGAVINLRPDLFKGVVAAVPFVDVVTTMLDPSIPLTTAEYDEWGNPNDRPYFDYMLSYSPYDNVEAMAYPNILVTTSLQDSQVQYWEPAKWVAKLRATKTDANRLLLRTYKEGSHGGVSGRYRRYRETAFVDAFLLDLVGIAK